MSGLQDKETQRIVNNESGDIIEMLNSEFDEFCRCNSLLLVCF